MTKTKKITAADIRAMAKAGELSPARAAQLLIDDATDISNGGPGILRQGVHSEILDSITGGIQGDPEIKRVLAEMLLNTSEILHQMISVGEYGLAYTLSKIFKLLYFIRTERELEQANHSRLDEIEVEAIELKLALIRDGIGPLHKDIREGTEKALALLEVAQKMEQLLGLEVKLTQTLEKLMEEVKEALPVVEQLRRDYPESKGIQALGTPITAKTLKVRAKYLKRWREWMVKDMGPNWWQVDALPGLYTSSEEVPVLASVKSSGGEEGE